MELLYDIDWPTLVVGTLLGLITAIIANLIHSRIANFLERTKFIQSSARRRSTLKRYNQLKDFHTGKKNIYLHALAWQLLLMTLFFLATSLDVVQVTHFVLHLIHSPGQPLPSSFRLLIFSSGFLTILSLAICIIAVFRLVSDYRLLMNFDAYETDLSKRYPDAFPPQTHT